MKMSRRQALSAMAATWLAAKQASAKTPLRAVTGARLLTPGQAPLDKITVGIQGGRITAVSTGAAKAGNDVLDAKGMTLTAGLIDPLTYLGLIDIGLEQSTNRLTHKSKEPIRAAFRAADGYNASSSAVAVTRLGGVTSVGVVPQGGLVSGQSAWVDLLPPGHSKPFVDESLALHVKLSTAHLDGVPMGRGSALLRLREFLEDARAYAKNPADYAKNRMRKLAASRLDLEAGKAALAGKLRLVVHADSAGDIARVVELAKQSSLKLIIASGAEAWRQAKLLADAKVPVIVDPLNNLPATFASRGARADNAKLLADAGVKIALSTFASHNVRKLRQLAGNAVRAGLSADRALEAVTRAPAEIFGLDATVGSVKAGKTANLVLWSGDPFELSTRVVAVIIRGRSLPLVSRQTKLLERYR